MVYIVTLNIEHCTLTLFVLVFELKTKDLSWWCSLCASSAHTIHSFLSRSLHISSYLWYAWLVLSFSFFPSFFGFGFVFLKDNHLRANHYISFSLFDVNRKMQIQFFFFSQRLRVFIVVSRSEDVLCKSQNCAVNKQSQAIEIERERKRGKTSKSSHIETYRISLRVITDNFFLLLLLHLEPSISILEMHNMHSPK